MPSACAGAPLLLSASVLVALAFPAASTAAPSHDAVPAFSAPSAERGVLRVSVAPEIVDASLISGWIIERNQRIEEQVPSFEGHEQWIAVNITGVSYDYRVNVTPMRDGAVVGAAQPPSVCACNSEALLGLTDDEIARAIEQLQAAPLEPEPESVIPPPASNVPAQPRSEPEPPPSMLDRRRISGLGIAGAVLTGVGGSAIAGGIAMTVLASRELSNATGLGGNWRPPGVVALSAGGAVLMAGVSMVVADVARCRKTDAPRRCRRRSEELAVGPTLEAGGGGVSIVGRF